MRKVLFLVLVLISNAASSDDFKLSFNSAPLDSVVKSISDLTGLTIVYNPEFNEKKLSLYIPQDKPISQVIPLFDSALQSVGLAFKYDKETHLSIDLLDKTQNYKTKIYTLSNHHNFESLSSNLKNFMPEDAKYLFLSTNNLIVTADQNTINRLDSALRNNYNNITHVYDLAGVLHQEALEYLKNSYPSSVFLLSNNRLIVEAEIHHQDSIRKFLASYIKKIQPYQVNFIISSISQTDEKNKDLSFVLNRGSFSLSNSFLNFNSSTNLDSFALFANFLNSFSSSEVLSRPHLQLIPEQKPSNFNLGQEISIKTSTIDQTTGQSIQNYERRNLGLNLGASLNFSYEDNLILNLTQSFSSLSGYDVDNNPVFDNQSIETVLNVRPGLVYVVGGVQDNRKARGKKSFFIPLSNQSSSRESRIIIFVYLTPIQTIQSETLPEFKIPPLESLINTTNELDGDFWYTH